VTLSSGAAGKPNPAPFTTADAGLAPAAEFATTEIGTLTPSGKPVNVHEVAVALVVVQV
jgi:hypothetical protein